MFTKHLPHSCVSQNVIRKMQMNLDGIFNYSDLVRRVIVITCKRRVRLLVACVFTVRSLGGTIETNNQYLDSFLRYEPRSDQWTSVRSVSRRQALQADKLSSSIHDANEMLF